MEHQYVIELKNIYKSYMGVPVLKDVSFQLEYGEIQAFVGQNGAGKSTLMKILSGSETADSGEIMIGGAKAERLSPSKAEELGIGIVHQELALCPELTVAENVFLAKEPLGKSRLIDQKEILQRTRSLFEKLQIQIDPKEYVRNLSIADQQMVEIAKAIEADPKVLIFDEPTASLNLNEVENLFEFMRLLQQRGVSMIYISHRLNEVFEVADRVTVLRDGSIINTRKTADTYAACKELIDNVVVSGTVVEIAGKSGEANVLIRGKALRQAISENSKVTLVDSADCKWDQLTAANTAADMISKYPDLTAFYCHNDDMASGVIQAVEDAGKTGQIKVIAMDGEPSALSNIAAGKQTATMGVPIALEGARCVYYAHQYLTGNSVPDYVETEIIPVTKDNVATYSNLWSDISFANYPIDVGK